MAFTLEAESNYLRQPAIVSIPNEKKEFYQQNTEQIASTTSRIIEDMTPHSSESNMKRNAYSLLKSNDNRSNIRNQSAISSNMIANIFEDFFMNTNDLFD
jgi:hypothetical protein